MCREVVECGPSTPRELLPNWLLRYFHIWRWGIQIRNSIRKLFLYNLTTTSPRNPPGCRPVCIFRWSVEVLRHVIKRVHTSINASPNSSSVVVLSSRGFSHFIVCFYMGNAHGLDRYRASFLVVSMSTANRMCDLEIEGSTTGYLGHNSDEEVTRRYRLILAPKCWIYA